MLDFQGPQAVVALLWNREGNSSIQNRLGGKVVQSHSFAVGKPLDQSFARHNGELVRTMEFAGTAHRSFVLDIADHGLEPESAWWQSILRGEKVRYTAGPDTVRVVDAFCGSGGLALGTKFAIEAIGRDVEFLAVIDTDETAVRIHERNLGAKLPLAVDASTLVAFDIEGVGAQARYSQGPTIEHQKLSQVGRVDVFVAGPPCQGHSNLNNYTRRQDPRNELYITAVSMGIALHAETILIENVPTVVNSHSDVVRTAIGLLESAGYGVTTTVLKSDALGAAQKRSRHFVMASRSRQLPDGYLASHAKRLAADPNPLSWAIGDILDNSAAGLFDTPPVIMPINAARIDYLFDNELYDLPDAQRPPCHQNGTSYKSVYGRMRWDRPAQTVTTGFGTAGQGRYIHPLRRRLVTPHEAARIQGFPDWYRFELEGMTMRRKHYAKWIGDAVHPILGYTAVLAAMSSVQERLDAEVRDAA